MTRPKKRRQCKILDTTQSADYTTYSRYYSPIPSDETFNPCEINSDSLAQMSTTYFTKIRLDIKVYDFNQSCKIAYPGVSVKIQKIEKFSENFFQISTLKPKIEF